MNEFDDPYLRNTLQQLGGHAADETAAFAAVQQRVRAVKRRRAMVASSGLAAVCLVAVVVAGVRNGGTQSVTPATNDHSVPSEVAISQVSSTTLAPTTTERATATTDATSTTETATTAETPTTPAPAPTTSSSTSTNTTVGPERTTPSTAASLPQTPGAGTPSSQAPTAGGSATTQPTPDAPETSSFSALHGSLTVELRSGQLRIVDHQSGPGFTYSVERNDPDRIRVRFGNGDVRSQIDVSIVGGHIAGNITEGSSGGTGTGNPPPTSGPVTSGP
ncbi:MAG: hypothetical protein JWN39_3224, partial [Ilumatobacteraceae bacterium]|nr:hypothetical protein [Ilumatobacteraceae bacterium]